MKFREYVGEKKVRQVREIIQTNIGPTEKDFLEQVAEPKKRGWTVETHLGFGLSKKNLKRIFDYIKSWLIRYDVPFKSINPYLTIYLLNNLPKISVLINNIKNTKKGVVYKSRGTITVVSPDERNFPRTIIEPKDDIDQILIDYIPNLVYQDILEQVFHSMDIKIIEKYRYPFVKLFEIESGILTPSMYHDMMYSAPKIPNLRLGNVGLIRRKHGNI